MIRDEKGEIYNKVENPCIVFDADGYVFMRIGEKENMETYFNQIIKKYRQNKLTSQYADSLSIMDLPKDQEEIDKVFQITGYIEIMLRKIIKESDN